MIVNPEIFQAVILDKQNHDYSNENIKYDNKTTLTASFPRLLGVQQDAKFNLSLHVSNIVNLLQTNQVCFINTFNNFLCFVGKRVMES